jgi:hypothetical protein
MLQSSRTALSNISKDNNMLAIAILSTKTANRLLQDTGQLTHFCISLILKQLEPGEASNILSVYCYTTDSTAYSSASIVPQLSGTYTAIPQTYYSRLFTTVKTRCKSTISESSRPLGILGSRGIRLQTS